MMFEDIKMKENFQQLFYASLYQSTNNDAKLMVGIYPLKKISESVYWFEEEPITREKREMFEEKLTGLLTKIFDKETPFTQTNDTDHCRYCPYKTICYRD